MAHGESDMYMRSTGRYRKKTNEKCDKIRIKRIYLPSTPHAFE